MDPLSVTASLLAVLGATSATARALQHITDLRHAPDQLVALINEVADLQVVLKIASEAVESRVETAHDCANLAHIVHRASESVAELDRLIHHELTRKGSAQIPNKKPKASHKGFLVYHGKLRSLRADIRETKLNLLIAVGTLTFADVSRLKLRISKVSVVDYLKYEHADGQGITEETRETIDSSSQSCLPKAEGVQWKSNSSGAVSNSEIADNEADRKLDSSRALDAHVMTSSTTSRLDDLVSVCTERGSENSRIKVEATVLPLHQCERFCLCRCHKVTNLATPMSLGNILGRLFVGYIGLPLLSYRTCNRITCRHGRSQTRIRVAFLFPLWFGLRSIALTITKASTTFMWTLSFPAVTHSGCSMLVLTSLGSIEKVQRLLATNAAVLNAVDIMASANLHLDKVAIQFRQCALVSCLIQQGADVLSQDCNKKTPLDTYFENYFTSPTEEHRMIALLPMFEKHDVCDHWNLSQIHLIVLGCSTVNLSTYLTLTYEDIDVVDSFGRTALMWAAWRGDHISFSTLLQFGANPHASSSDGNSVLIYATYGGSLECLRLVVGAGAEVNYMSHSLATPVMLRPRLGENEAIAKQRVERGASIEGSRQQKFTPLYVAALTNQVENLAYLLDSGATTDMSSWDCSTPISVAISLNNHGIIEELIKRDCDLYMVSNYKMSRLATVAMFGDERTMRLFMDAKPAIDIHLRDTQGRTAHDYLRERMQNPGLTDLERERLATTFQRLVDICSEAYDKVHSSQCQVREEMDHDPEDEAEVFQDALEDNGGLDCGQ